MGRRFFACLFLAFIAALGYWIGADRFSPKGLRVSELSSFSPTRSNQFVAVIYAKDDVAWCEKTLRSIFEQNYDAYRVIFIDDGSMDGTFEKVHRFVEENRQEARVILIQNGMPMGLSSSLKRAADQCFDTEIIMPLYARDWLAHPEVFSCLNRAFEREKPDSILIGSIQYPDYTIRLSENGIGYATYFRTLNSETSYLKALNKTKRQEKILDPLVFQNKTLAREGL